MVEDTYRITQQLPKQEDYAFCNQLRKAALNVTGNIAEGFGRGHTKDKIHFYLFARGSAHEIRSHLFSGDKVAYFSMEQTVAFEQKCKQIIEALKKLMKSLNNA